MSCLRVFSINCYQPSLLQISLEIELHCRLSWHDALWLGCGELRMDLRC